MAGRGWPDVRVSVGARPPPRERGSVEAPRERGIVEGPRERGSVTAETAVVLPALAALLVMCLWAVTVVGQQLRCIDAARVAARALARGETEPLARSAAREAAPEGATISVRTVDGLAVVEVRLTAGLPGPWESGGGGPMGVDIGSRAVAALEGR